MALSEQPKVLREVLVILTGCGPVCNVMKSICLGPEVMGVQKLPIEIAHQ